MVLLNTGDPDAVRRVTVEVQAHLLSRGVVSWWDDETVLRVDWTAVRSNRYDLGKAVDLTSIARHLLTRAQGDTPARISPRV